MSKQFTTVLSFALAMLLSVSASAMYTTYQAKIIKPDGTPLESTSVNFRFTILDPLGSCILYTENFNTINMAGSGGLVYFSLGSGIKTFPASGTVSFSDVFNNQGGSLSCEVGGPPSYTPTANDLRKIVMQFHDGTGWQTLPAMAINHVPYAMYAKNAASATTSINSTQLNGKTDLDFVQVTSIPTCTASQALQFNGASFNCVAVGSSSGGTVVSVSGTAPMTISGSASAPVISISVASTTSDGYLTAADYSEFKTKLSASSTEITNILGYAPVSSSAVAAQIASAAASANTANTIVKRDSSGNFSANDISANSTKTNYVDIYRPSTSFNIRLQAPTSLSANYTLILPDNDGFGGQFLTTDGSGNLSWTSQTTTAISSSDVITALGYTPANSATASTLQSDLFAVSATASNALVKSNNLSDLTNAATARTNLGLGTFATASNIDLGSASATGTIADARLPNQAGVSSGTEYTKVTVDGKGRVTSGAQLSASDVTTALGYTPQASGVISSQWVTSGTTINYSSGNVGIGTANPGTKLAVQANTAPGISVINNNSGSNLSNGSEVGRLSFHPRYNGGVSEGAYITSYYTGSGSDRSADLRFYTTGSASSAMTVADYGWVGIGTNAPNVELEVVGQVISDQYLTASGMGDFAGAKYNFNAGDLELVTNYSTKRIVVKASTGNVGIGTSSPTAKLDVAGTVSATSTITAANFSISGGNGNPAVLKSYQDSGGNGSLYVGNQSGGSGTNGFNTFFNTIVGHSSYGNNSTGTGNTVVGKSSYTGSSGSNNTFMGTFSGQRVIGDDNVLLGAYTGQGVTGSNITGNVIIGRNAGNAITTGAYNTIIGTQAASNTISSGSYNILIGYQATLPVSNTSNFLNIGNLIYGQLSTAKMGIGTTTPATKLSVSGGLQISMESASCSATYAGTLRYNAGSVQFCDGTTWSSFGVAANYVVKSNNLSDLTSSATARTNLGLGALATASTIDLSTASATGVLSVARLPSFAGDVTSVSGSNSLTVDGLQGRSVDSTAPTSGQVLAYNGSAWTPVSLTATGDFMKDGSVAMTGVFKASDGTAAAPSIAFASDTNTGFYKDYADSFAMVANGSIMFSFGYGSMISTATNGAKINTAAGTAANPVYTFNGVHNSGVFAPGGQVLAFSTSSTERVRIDDSGDVGIGTTTPGSRLVVKGAGTTSATSTLNVTSSLNTSLFYVRDDGRVGAGSTSPEGRMEVAGLAWGNYASSAGTSYYPFNTSGQGTSFMEITNTATGYSSPGAYLGLKTTAMSGTPYQRAYIGVVSNMGASHTPDIIIGQQTGATAYQERLRINSTGYVGIGTTSPRGTLDINGTVLMKPAVSDSTSPIDFSTGNLQYTSGNCGTFALHNMKDGGSYTFAVKGATSTTCTFTAYSDTGTTALTVHMPTDHGATTPSKHTLYTFLVMGTDLYVTWMPGM